MLGLAMLAMTALSDPTRATAPTPIVTDDGADAPSAILRVPGDGATPWQLGRPMPPAPPRDRLVDRLGVDAIADERQSLRLGIAPPGRRRPLLGIHYRLTLDD